MKLVYPKYTELREWLKAWCETQCVTYFLRCNISQQGLIPYLVLIYRDQNALAIYRYQFAGNLYFTDYKTAEDYLLLHFYFNRFLQVDFWEA